MERPSKKKKKTTRNSCIGNDGRFVISAIIFPSFAGQSFVAHRDVMARSDVLQYSVVHRQTSVDKSDG